MRSPRVGISFLFSRLRGQRGIGFIVAAVGCGSRTHRASARALSTLLAEALNAGREVVGAKRYKSIDGAVHDVVTSHVLAVRERVHNIAHRPTPPESA
jgi:hypothetical protein